MISFIVLLSASLFTSSLIVFNIKTGMDKAVERMGADIIVIPNGYKEDLKTAMFTGKACTIYFEGNWAEKLSSVEGVKKASSQLYLATMTYSLCCVGGNQLIAYDEDTDFIVKSWLYEDGKLKKDEVIVGSDLIVGHSGCGKSTLLNMIAGILKPTEGEIFINDINILNRNQKQLASIRQQVMAYILQGYNLLSNFTILENVCMPLYLSGNKNVDTDAAVKILDSVGLKDVINSYPTSLSGGEQRRAAIAKALMQNPKIIIADEPTSNLDYENSINVMESLKKAAGYGVSVLISTHEKEFYHYFDRLYKREKGCIV